MYVQIGVMTGLKCNTTYSIISKRVHNPLSHFSLGQALLFPAFTHLLDDKPSMYNVQSRKHACRA